MLQLTHNSPYNHKAFHSKHNSTPEPMFDAVLFDLFDTLVLLGDEHESYIKSLKKTHRYLSDNGLDCSFNTFKQAYFKAVDKISTETAYSLEEPHLSTYIEVTLTMLRPNLKGKTFLALESVNEFSKEFKKHIKIDPQTLDALRLIHRGHKVGLISNLSFSECAWDLLEEFDLKQFFDVIIVSGDVNLRKPHPQIFNMALRYLEVKPSRAVFVGDTLETDVLGSKNAGMTSVHIKRKVYSQKVEVKPHLTVTELNQLLPFLGIETSQDENLNLTCQI